MCHGGGPVRGAGRRSPHRRGTQWRGFFSVPTSTSLWKIDPPWQPPPLQPPGAVQWPPNREGPTAWGKRIVRQGKRGIKKRRGRDETEKIASLLPYVPTSTTFARRFSLFHFRPHLSVAGILKRSKVETPTYGSRAHNQLNVRARRWNLRCVVYRETIVPFSKPAARFLVAWMRVNQRHYTHVFSRFLAFSPVFGRASSPFKLVRDEERPVKSLSRYATLLCKQITVLPC